MNDTMTLIIMLFYETVVLNCVKDLDPYNLLTT